MGRHQCTVCISASVRDFHSRGAGSIPAQCTNIDMTDYHLYNLNYVQAGEWLTMENFAEVEAAVKTALELRAHGIVKIKLEKLVYSSVNGRYVPSGLIYWFVNGCFISEADYEAFISATDQELKAKIWVAATRLTN